MEIPFINDIVIILGLAVGVILVFQRFRLPLILGFLITGIIAGPYGLSLVKASHEVELMAEVGVILLLFIIGMEFSLKSLAAIKKAVFLGGSAQVVITILVVSICSTLAGLTLPPEGVFLGFLFALSSTAIVLKLLQDRGEINTPHGKTSLAILIFQDIMVVPMMLFIPLLAGKSDDVGLTLLYLAIKGIFVIILVIVCARWVVPLLLYQIAKTKSKELFLLSIVVICFSVAWLTSSIGLSLALGAFLAGLIISESEYSHQATSNIIPFREIFSSFFFVSIGMLLDVTFLFEHIFIILSLTLLTFFAKGGIAALAAWSLRYPARTVLLVGLSLFQVGEFSFILSKVGLDYGILDREIYQYFLAISVLTMAITPTIIKNGNKIYFFTTGIFPHKKSETLSAIRELVHDKQEKLINDHLVVIGFGINGKNVARAAKQAGIPYVVIELNPETIRKEKKLGEPIIYGDAVHMNILNHVNIPHARVVVVAISDPEATRQIIANIRQLSKKVHIIVRTRLLEEMERIYKLGADEVIPEEFETSIEIFTRVLNKYLIPQNQIEDFTRTIRADNYEMLRVMTGHPHKEKNNFDLPDVELAALTVEKSDSSIVDRKLSESNIRRNYKINVVAIKREGTIYANIEADTVIQQQDILYVFGRPEDILAFNKKIGL